LIKVRTLIFCLALALIAVSPAGAQLVPGYVAGALPLAEITPYGTVGSGISESSSWTQGAGAAAATDAFTNSVVGPFGSPFFDSCPFGSPFGGFGGLAQNGVGTNFGAQNTASSTFDHSSTFGLPPLSGVVFGIPVAGAGGLAYC